MKILYVTTIGVTMGFFKSLIKELIDDGNIVDIATNETDSKVPDCYREWGCKVHQIDCSRSPLNFGNIKAVQQLSKLVESEKYDIVHCHTPIAAMCTRLACIRARKNGVKVFYTAHGFHFYDGAPLLNWLIYYPVEWVCSFFTDTLITINKEDYTRAQKHMHAKKVEYVPGVGIDVDKFKNTVIDKKAKREELGIPEDAFLLVSVGELNKNKNHEIVIKALAKLNNHNVHYAIAGVGELRDYLFILAKNLGIQERIHLLGYRTDIPEIYKSADVYIHPSFREGLPVSVMEAMASGLPCLVSKIRGNVDLLNEDSKCLISFFSDDQYKLALQNIIESDLEVLSVDNQNKAKYFSKRNVIEKIKMLYGFLKVD